MNIEYVPFGQAHNDLNPDHLRYEPSKSLLKACDNHKAFEVIELRGFEYVDKSSGSRHDADVIVVDIAEGTVPSRNSIGIKNRERLALVYRSSGPMPYEVRALRVRFPTTIHQNHVIEGEPASLCLFFEPWTSVERTWTPQRHLERICWWLRETSQGTLHRNDQPLEQLYFATPYQIVLPPDFHQRVSDRNRVLCFYAVPCSAPEPKIYRGVFKSSQEAKKYDDFFTDFLVLPLKPVLPGPIEKCPWTLGTLHDQLVARRSDLIETLINAIKNAVPSDGLSQGTGQRGTLLILSIPLLRKAENQPERTDLRGFLVHTDLSKLGIATGALCISPGDDNKAYCDIGENLAGVGVESFSSLEWRKLTLEPVDVRLGFSCKDARRSSGVPEINANFAGIIAGLGALGSILAELWSRAGWGNWTYIDNDILRAHNVVRHICKDGHIGYSKVDAVAQMVEQNYASNQVSVTCIYAKVTDFSNQKVIESMSSATLLVDATTTLEAPRDLSGCDSVPRSVSVFLSPSGLGSVLLIEDDKRSIRLSSLEAQYYRAILRSEWGATHLNGHNGELWVGAGCRDISTVMSNELIQLHGATIARHIRTLANQTTAGIRVWSLDDGLGTLLAKAVPVSRSFSNVCGDWRIVCDEDLREHLCNLRTAELPNETGGILLGYFDQKSKVLHLVDALPEPADSDSDCSGFTRGTNGLEEALDECHRRTAHIVSYVGEWHSHPQYALVRPSTPDIKLLAHLTAIMTQDGLPALMLIIGENEINFSLGKTMDQ